MQEREGDKIRFTLASASYKDWSDELKEAGFKVVKETEITMRQFLDIKITGTGVTKAILEIDSLDELIKLKETVKHDLVISNDGDFWQIPQIVIYDGYLE